jgi:hypothetical protein
VATQCKTYQQALDVDYSAPEYLTVESKETGLVASAYLGNVDIISWYKVKNVWLKQK